MKSRTRPRSRAPLAAIASALLLLTACRDDPASAGSSDTDPSGTQSDSDPTAGTSGTASGGTESDSETESDTGPMVDFEPAPGGMRKLMFREYHDSIEMMLGRKQPTLRSRRRTSPIRPSMPWVHGCCR